MEISHAISLIGTDSPAGFILTLLFIMALMSGLLSKAAADYLGIFGALARALQRHREKAIAADEASDAARLDRLEDTIKRLDEEVEELREKDKSHHEYQLYVTGYWRRLQLWAVEKGVTLPPPPMMTYPEWKATRAAENNPE